LRYWHSPASLGRLFLTLIYKCAVVKDDLFKQRFFAMVPFWFAFARKPIAPNNGNAEYDKQNIENIAVFEHKTSLSKIGAP